MLTIQDLTIRINTRDYTQGLFNPINLNLDSGKILGITGEAASGKSSLLMAIGGYIHSWLPTALIQGKIKRYNREVIQGKTQQDVAIVLENPYNQFSGLKTSVQNELVLPLELIGATRSSMTQYSEALSMRLGIHEILNSNLQWLSGGEIVRLHIASALIAQPKIILFDNVFSELDPDFKYKLINIIREYVVHFQSIAVFSFNLNELPFDTFDKTLSLEKNADGIHETPTPTPKSYKFVKNQVSTKESAIKISQLFFKYPKQKKWLINDFSLELNKGEGILLLGPNGSGKTTLSKILLGLLDSQKGTIKYFGKDINSYHDLLSSHIISCSLQNPDLMFTKNTVQKEILNAPSRANSYEDLLTNLSLNDVLDENPYDLSRAQKKRLALLLMCITNPSILFLDEPTQYQDQNGVDFIIAIIFNLINNGTAIICATHDERLISKLDSFNKLKLQPTQNLTENKLITDFSVENISDVKTWAVKSWQTAIPDWIDSREERYIYRNKGSFKGELSNIIRQISNEDEPRILDIGCGDGVDTKLTKSYLDMTKFPKAHILGIDNQKLLISYAKWLYDNDQNLHFDFIDAINTSKIIKSCYKNLGGLPNLITAIYSLHDEPQIKKFLYSVSKLLIPDGYMFAVIANPKWAERLNLEGSLYKVKDYTLKQEINKTNIYEIAEWRWSAYFPMIMKNTAPFYLPYFHRTIDDYTKLFSMYGLEVDKIINLDTNTASSYQNKISLPQKEIKINPYKKTISKQPFSILFILKKSNKTLN